MFAQFLPPCPRASEFSDPPDVRIFFEKSTRSIMTFFANLAKNWLKNFGGLNEKSANIVIWAI